jgi:ribosome biogenesis ATPase
LDTGVRGRFSREIALPVPDASARTDILKLVTKTINLAPDVDLQSLGKATPGYVGSDLYALASEAGLEAIRRIVQDSTSALSLPSNISLCEHHSEVFQHVVSKNASLQRSIPSVPPSAVEEFELTEESSEMERELNRSEESMILADPLDRTPDFHSIDPLPPSSHPSCFYCALANGTLSAETHQSIAVTMNDFSVAIKSVLPSAKREGFAVVPDVTWSDVGALSEVHSYLLESSIHPFPLGP